jgi:hypothetical protein
MPGFNVEDFKSELNKRNGVMRNNRFLLTFATPNLLRASEELSARYPTGSLNRSIEFWCESVNMPGYQLMQHDTRRWTYGPSEKRPFAPNFQSLQCSFIADGNGDIWKFFNNWLFKILPHNTSRGFNHSGFGSFPYELEYKTDYVTQLHIGVFDEKGRKQITIICNEAFPSQVIDTNLNWADTNGTAKVGVVFEYLDWYIPTSETE